MLSWLARVLRVRTGAPTPLGRWAVGGDWETRARLASQDSCCCTQSQVTQYVIVGDDVIETH